MKLQLSVCAKDLPNESDVHCTATRDGAVVGKTEVIQNTVSPSWNKLIVFECDEDSPGEVSVAICNSDGEIGSAAFDIGEVLGSDTKAIAKGINSDAVVGVHMQERTNTGTFKLKIHGKKLKDLDGLLNKSDPYFELKGLSGETVYTSEVKDNDLNPEFALAEIDLDALCGGNLDAPLKLIVWDEDAKGRKDPELMGSIDLSVNGWVNTTWEAIPLLKKGKQTGKFYVDEAEVVGGLEASEEEKVEIENAAIALVEKLNARRIALEKAEAAKAAQENADEKQSLAEDKEEAAKAAAEAESEARAKVTELEEASNAAAENAETQTCTGTLKVQIRAEGLEDTDGFLNKTDPYFEVFGVEGTSVYRSDVLEDKLDPIWGVAEIDVCDLTGGDLDMPFRITLNDHDEHRDGSASKDYLGSFQTSVNSILSMAPDEGTELLKGGGAGNGQVFITQAELVDFQDSKVAAKEARDAYNEAKIAMKPLADALEATEEEANAAREAADEAAKAAAAALEEAEAARVAAGMGDLEV